LLREYGLLTDCGGKSLFVDAMARTPEESRQIAKGFAAAATVVVFWSGFNIVSRLGGRSELTPFDMAAIRFGVSGILLCPFFFWGRRSITWLQSVVLASLGGLGYGLFVYSGFSLAPAAHAGILVNGGIPFATALVSWAAMGYRPGRRAILSLVVAALGIALIGVQSFSRSGGFSGGQWLGDLFFLCAATCFASFGLLMKKWRVQPWETTVGIATISMLAYLPVYALFLPKGLASVSTALILLQCLYQGVIAASLAGLLYAYANQTIGPMKASLMLALVPGISAVAAVPLLGEALGMTTLLGVILVTAGAVLGTTNQAPR
jgi:drug/metabolite transporter (DMT)-like permease